ncbi:hypothetical protein [Streptomyces albus]|uniref:hypothetical protein n=1 Tax=Streptomyces albus TaxID=1888 RepID=UPI003B98513D
MRSFAERLAEIGRLPLLGAVACADEFGLLNGPRSNGAQRLRAVHEALTLPPELAASLASVNGPVLLVDDYTETGWTLTVAARMLRQAGAKEVLPLVLAVQN